MTTLAARPLAGHSLKRPRLLAFLALSLAAALTGCVQPGFKRPDATLGTDAPAWRQHRSALQGLERWRVQGQIGVQGPEEGGSAHMSWQQRGERYDIRLSGPLGQGSLRIRGTPRGVRLDSSEHGTRFARSPQALLERTFGWQVPVSHLLYWVKGLPAPGGGGPSAPLIDAKGRLVEIEQEHWRVRYHRYQQSDGYQLPAKLVIEAQQGPELKLTMVLRNWRTGPTKQADAL